MKTITLQEAADILIQAEAVIINDHALNYACVDDLTGEDENEFLRLCWEDEGHDCILRFCEGSNRTVQVEGAYMYLHDLDSLDGNETEATKLTILGLKKIA